MRLNKRKLAQRKAVEASKEARQKRKSDEEVEDGSPRERKAAKRGALAMAEKRRRGREEGELVKDEVKEETEETSEVQQEEEAEVLPPPPPKKIRLVISNGNNIGKKVREEPPLQSRPSNPSPSYCFVCVKRIPKRTRLRGEDFSGLLEMLEIGEDEAEQLMTRLGREPERWIGLCGGCLKVVRETVKIRREMEEELRKRQRLIVEKMKRTELISFGGEGEDPTISEETRFALESILQFVRSRDYDSVKFKRQKKPAKNKSDLISRMPPPPPPISVSAPSNDYSDFMGDDDLIDDDPLSPDTNPIQLPTPKASVPQPKTINLPIQFLLPAQPPPPKQLLYCGLCGDNKAYLTQAQLQLHTKQAHRPPNPEMMMVGEREDDDDDSSVSSKKIEVVTSSKLSFKVIHAAVATITSNVNRQEEAQLEDLAPVYDCPHCPEVKAYPLTLYAQHLAIHQRRPFKCSICSVFFPADDDLREQHWTQKHPDQSSTDKFMEVALDPGKIWGCGGAGCHLLFPTEDARELHELSCTLFHKSLRLQKVPSKELSCSVCKKQFRTRDEWRLHRLVHHPEIDSKSCLFCNLSFSDRTIEGVEARNDPKMILHANRFHRGEIIRANSGHYHPVLLDECEECGLVFEFLKDWQDHLKDEHNNPDKAYSCPYCTSGYSNRATLHLHLGRKHFVEELVCEVCREIFKGEELLVEHRLKWHDLSPEDTDKFPVLSCPEKGCKFKTVLKQKFSSHTYSTHGPPEKFKCKYCGKDFKTYLAAHHRIHENKKSKPYQCEICGESFKGEETLVGHRLRIHDLSPEDTKKYPVLTCPTEGCQYKTVSKQNFNIHTSNTHGEPGKLKCKYCGKGFKHIGHLADHHRLHENKESKPYQCEICGNSFAVKRYLRIHKRLSHEGRTFPSTNKQKQRKRVPGGKGEGRRNTRVKAVDPEADQDQDKTDQQGAVEVSQDKEGGQEKPSSLLPSAEKGN